MNENAVLAQAKKLYHISECGLTRVSAHEGGRNAVYIVTSAGGERRILRISALPDRSLEAYISETGFVHYLARHGAPVADVLPSLGGRLVEEVKTDTQTVYLSMFEYAPGGLISDYGYIYRNGAPLSEYFYNTGKTLGAIHRLSKQYPHTAGRPEYADKYSREYINQLIPDIYSGLKQAIFRRLTAFEALPMDSERYGLIHFDFSDGNYHIDMQTGKITVFDFDNCMYCWYMFDLANLWTHGEGWCRGIADGRGRMEYMKGYFDKILEGYRTETTIPDDMLEKLPLFIDMVLIENIVDEFECCKREGEFPDYDDIRTAAECLINDIPFAGTGR